ncbi:hypothetical protein CPHO_07720 [Corynebacterium phocae]|uniref:Uncharacterized protein n=1 Tax=Corynebacterium phocae TaxID=161895 RepID=A0A1L7D3Q2_9CORY|nr:hypothetical protein CPHO_07720 [Corynebacterium phocae]
MRGSGSQQNSEDKIRKSRSTNSTVMMAAAMLGLLFMVIGLPPLGGVCFIVAFICALTEVFKAIPGVGR